MKRIHENSLAAFDDIVDERSTREEAVYAILVQAGRPMTDREIVHALGFHDMNAARPRITSLRDNRWVAEVDCVECPVTRKRVRRVKALSPSERADLIASQRARILAPRPATQLELIAS